MPTGFLDSLDWDHPAVQNVFNQALGRVMHKLFPPEPEPDPYRAHLERMLSLLEREQASKDAALMAAAGGTAVATTAARSSAQPSRYLASEGQPGADEAGWDTSCLGCATSHLSLTKAMLEKAAASSDPAERQRYIATARGELSALFAADWTAERIARTPPEHRAIIERYLPEVRRLQQQISTPYAASAVTMAGLASESTRFAFEDGMDHPEVQGRLSRIEELAVEAERVDLGPERIESLPPDQQDRAIDLRNRLRRLRQTFRPGVLQDPKQLNAAAAESERLSRELQTLGSTDGRAVKSAAVEMATLKESFRSEVGALSQTEADRAVDVAAKVAGGKMQPDEARRVLEVAS